MFLCFEDVPGLISAWLNGAAIGPTPIPGNWEVAISQRLSSNNQLVLVLDPALVANVEGWGKIAIVVRS